MSQELVSYIVLGSSKHLADKKEIKTDSYEEFLKLNFENIDSFINQYKDYEDNISIIKDSNFNNSNNYPNYFSYPNPLSEFPKGTIAGTCLHKIIERFEFRNDNNQELIDLIIEELNFHQIDTSLAFKVKDAILRIINISLGREFVNRYSARVFFPLVNKISSTPFRIFSTFVSIS